MSTCTQACELVLVTCNCLPVCIVFLDIVCKARKCMLGRSATRTCPRSTRAATGSPRKNTWAFQPVIPQYPQKNGREGPSIHLPEAGLVHSNLRQSSPPRRGPPCVACFQAKSEQHPHSSNTMRWILLGDDRKEGIKRVGSFEWPKLRPILTLL